MSQQPRNDAQTVTSRGFVAAAGNDGAASFTTVKHIGWANRGRWRS